MNSKKLIIFFVSWVFFSGGYIFYSYFSEGAYFFSPKIIIPTILGCLLISTAITFNLDKTKLKTFWYSFFILSTASIITAAYTSRSQGDDYTPLFVIAIELVAFIISVFITGIINPLIRKYYLKEK